MIASLPGPILIIGASGFIGANLLRQCLAVRTDVVGTGYDGPAWRLYGISPFHLWGMDNLNPDDINRVFREVNPRTIFDCSSYGAYSFEQDPIRIHSTNYLGFINLMEEVSRHNISAYIHAGSSSEYGLNAAGPAENDELIPNSHYAVSKAATAQAIACYGKVRGVPVVNLRLYSAYGPYEDSSRLIPVLCDHAIRGKLPPFARSEVSRDFIHVDDVVSAFVAAALNPCPGESFNIGTGVQTSLAGLATLTKELFAIHDKPEYSADKGRAWDVDNWYANPAKAKKLLGWEAKISLAEGLEQTCDWWRQYLKSADFARLTKKGV